MRLAAMLLAGALLAPPSHAAPEVDEATRAEAKKHVERANLYYKLGEWDKALEEFREAYKLVPAPGLLFNLGQAARLKGDHDMAKFYYETYLRDKPDAPNRVEVEEYVAQLNKTIQGRLVEEERKRRENQGALAAPAPGPGPENRSPTAAAQPAREGALPAQGEPRSPPVAGAAPEPGEVYGEPAPPAAVSPPAEPSSASAPFYTTWWFWTAVGVAAAGGATVAVLSSQGTEIPKTQLGTVKF